MAISSSLGSSALLPAGLGFRNVIINGDFKVWQRGTSTTGYAYSSDRWLAYQAAAVNTISQQSTSLNGFPYCARVQRNSGATNTGATYLVQAVESINGYQFQGKTATLSFYARAGSNFSSAGSVLTANIETSTGTDQSYIAAWAGGVAIPSSKTLTTSWQLFTVTGVVPATANQVAVAFTYTPTGTAGAADYFEITGVQLEQNYQPTPFEQRPIGVELALCQRYFQLMNSYMGSGDFNVMMVREVATQAQATIWLPVTMRIYPSIVGTSYGRCVFRDTSFGLTTASVSSIITNTSGPSNNAVTIVITHSSVSGTYVYSEWDMNATNASLGLSAEL